MPETPETRGTLWALAERLGHGEPGLTFAETWSAIREAGLPTTRQAFLDVWHGAAQLRGASATLAGMGPDEVPTSDAIVETPLDYGQRYAYRVAYEGTHTEVGEPVSGFVTVLSDRIVPLGDAITTAIANIIGDPEAYMVNPTGAAVVGIYDSGSAFAGA